MRGAYLERQIFLYFVEISFDDAESGDRSGTVQ